MRSDLCGQTPGIPLNARGIDEARALATRLRRPDILIASPIERALETAQILGEALGVSPVISAAFIEFDFGEWTGRSFDSLREDPLWAEFNRDRETGRAPGGESMAEVLERAMAAVNEFPALYPDCENIAIVSHGDVIRSLLVHAAQTSLNAYWRFTVEPASITQMEWYSPTSARILRVNDTAHLERVT